MKLKKRDWKTTLIGLGTAAANIALASAAGHVTAKDALISAGIAALGTFAKDSERAEAAPDFNVDRRR